MRLPIISRFRWPGLVLILCGALLLLGIIIGQIPLTAVTSGATPGVHLGNVPGGWFWDEKYFSRIRGKEENYPGVIVVMSDQVYRYVRSPENCGPIETVYVPDTPSHQAVWSYKSKIERYLLNNSG